MRHPALWLAGLLALTACGRCGRGGGAPDAGLKAEAGTGAQLVPGTDLRSALLLAFNEFRGVRQIQGLATYARTLALSRPAPEVVAELKQALAAKGFTSLPEEDALLRMEREPYRVEARAQDGALQLAVQLPVAQKDVSALLYARSAPTTDDFAALLPRLPGTRATAASFSLVLLWRATSPQAARLLVEKQSQALAKADWRVVEPLAAAQDGGVGSDSTRLQRLGGLSTVSFERQEESARVRYEEPLPP